MLSFCGLDKAVVDANGRLRLSPNTVMDFKKSGGLEVVLHCIPEGAVAVYSEDVYLQMRNNEHNPAEKASNSFVYRRIMRRFGSMSQSECISGQGRITIPESYRQFAAIQPGMEVVVVGCEIGVEIWNAERWENEFNEMNKHMRDKGDIELSADIVSAKQKEASHVV